MPARNIHLTHEWDQFVTDQVESGKYANASEVVRAGLHALQYQQEEQRLKLEALRVAIAEGMKGPFHDGETVLAEVREAIRKRAANRHRKDRIA